MKPAVRTALQILLTLGVSAAGGFLFDATGLPAGWLMGGALAVAETTSPDSASRTRRAVSRQTVTIIGRP